MRFQGVVVPCSPHHNLHVTSSPYIMCFDPGSARSNIQQCVWMEMRLSFATIHGVSEQSWPHFEFVTERLESGSACTACPSTGNIAWYPALGKTIRAPKTAYPNHDRLDTRLTACPFTGNNNARGMVPVDLCQGEVQEMLFVPRLCPSSYFPAPVKGQAHPSTEPAPGRSDNTTTTGNLAKISFSWLNMSYPRFQTWETLEMDMVKVQAIRVFCASELPVLQKPQKQDDREVPGIRNFEYRELFAPVLQIPGTQQHVLELPRPCWVMTPACGVWLGGGTLPLTRGWGRGEVGSEDSAHVRAICGGRSRFRKENSGEMSPLPKMYGYLGIDGFSGAEAHGNSAKGWRATQGEGIAYVAPGNTQGIASDMKLTKKPIIYTVSFVHHESIDHHNSAIVMSIVTPQRKRNDLTLADKVKVIQMLDGVPKTSQTEVASKFGCSRSQVSRAYQNRAAILQQWDNNRNPNGKRKREAKNAEVDEALYRWYVNAKARSAPVSGPILREKAKALAEGLGCEDFKPSDGWLGRWKTRHNISTRGNVDSSSRFVADRPVEDTQQETTDLGVTSIKTESTDNDDEPSQPATATSQLYAEIDIEEATVTEGNRDINACLPQQAASSRTESPMVRGAPEARSDSIVRVEPANCANVQSRVPPTLSELEEAIDVIRRWMRFHGLQHSPEYGTLLAIERNIYDHFRKAKKQKSIAQYFKPTSK
ncbi:hypothetical protein Bbelb_177020 [Branchiostoma belcheri]|nr:hypothetical protein Bbelb_177020 [Branchiostoma belcheri]